MEIRDMIVIFHFHYWRIPSEAVNKNNHLPQWFYPTQEVDIAFQHLCWIFQQNVGEFHYTEWATYITMKKSSLSLVQLVQAQPIGSRDFCLKKKPIDGSQI
jgi:hypothetical protein